MAPRCQGSVGAIAGAVPGVISLSPGEAVVGAHQGRHSKLAQYRRMKTDWKTNVYLARSRIQVSLAATPVGARGPGPARQSLAFARIRAGPGAVCRTGHREVHHGH